MMEKELTLEEKYTGLSVKQLENEIRKLKQYEKKTDQSLIRFKRGIEMLRQYGKQIKLINMRKKLEELK